MKTSGGCLRTECAGESATASRKRSRTSAELPRSPEGPRVDFVTLWRETSTDFCLRATVHYRLYGCKILTEHDTLLANGCR